MSALTHGDGDTAFLTAVAAHGLPGSGVALPEKLLPEQAWRRLITGVRAQRLAGHLLDAVINADFPVTAAQADEAVALHTGAMGQVLRLDRLLLETVALLERNGCEVRALKGASLAHLAYPSPFLRVYGDVDLLVRPEQFDDAGATLSAHGCQRRWPQLRPGFDRRFGKGATFITPEGLELDVHRTPALGPFGLTVDLPTLWTRSTAFALGGRTLHTLAPEERFLFACYHAALGNPTPRLVALRDVAQLLLATDIDAERVLRLADEWSARPVVSRAVRAAWDTLGLTVEVALSAWSRRYRPCRREQRVLAVYERRRHSYGRKALASFRVIHGLPAKAAFLHAVAVPERAAVNHYERTYGHWWRRGGRALLHRGESP